MGRSSAGRLWPTAVMSDGFEIQVLRQGGRLGEGIESIWRCNEMYQKSHEGRTMEVWVTADMKAFAKKKQD